MKTKHFFIVLAAVAVCFTACKKDEKATPVTGITLNYEELTLIPDDTITLIATVQPDDATNKTVIWKSSNPNVATVNSEGMVTAVANGKTTIIAITQDGDKIATCAVTVDYRSQWVGDWDFVVKRSKYNVDSIGQQEQDTVYYLGKISIGNAFNQLNIKFTENDSTNLNVSEDGEFSTIPPYYDPLSGKFEGENKIYLYLYWGGQGGGITYIIDGIKKEGCKK